MRFIIGLLLGFGAYKVWEHWNEVKEQRALEEKLSVKDIKKTVTNWRPDYSRV